jgi:hypothetical protein
MFIAHWNRLVLIRTLKIVTYYKVTDVTSQAIRCYELDSTSATQAGIATVTAGSTVGFKADNTMGHPGVRAYSIKRRDDE